MLLTLRKGPRPRKQRGCNVPPPPPQGAHSLGRTRANRTLMAKSETPAGTEKAFGCGPEELVKMHKKQQLRAKNFLVIHSAPSSLSKKARPVCQFVGLEM